MTELHTRVLDHEDQDLLQALDGLAAIPPPYAWREAAIRLYVQWLKLLAGETAPREPELVAT